MVNPVIAEVTRGQTIESQHRGAVCVVDADGAVVFSAGDVNAGVFPRSAVKAIQALPLIETGAADAFGFGDTELSLACSSHSGEPEHVALAQSILARAGLDEDCLECGGHYSSQLPVALAQSKIYEGTPPAICNNCSGKHAGFLSVCAHEGDDPAGYIRADHAAMMRVNDVLQDVTGAAHDEGICGTDGCSIPTYAIPLSAMARGFAKMGSGVGLGPQRAKAAKRLLSACMAEPFYMAGTKRFCTEYMTLGAGRLFAKTGAEGVFCGAIPELGLGIALKCEDGGTRAAEVAMAAVTKQCLAKDDPLQVGLSAMADVPLVNWNGIEVGRIREPAR
ncbi:MAG: asparaginase [Pseudomonadota bacterium]